MPGVWEEVYGQKEHDLVPTEKLFGANRENLVAAGIRRGCIRTGRSIWGAGDYHPHLAMQQRDAGKESARAVSWGTSPCACAVGWTVGKYYGRHPGHEAVKWQAKLRSVMDKEFLASEDQIIAGAMMCIEIKPAILNKETRAKNIC